MRLKKQSMRDIFYNQTHKIGSKEWLVTLNESELAEWNWIHLSYYSFRINNPTPI